MLRAADSRLCQPANARRLLMPRHYRYHFAADVATLSMRRRYA